MSKVAVTTHILLKTTLRKTLKMKDLYMNRGNKKEVVKGKCAESQRLEEAIVQTKKVMDKKRSFATVKKLNA
jgi:hypothetical protein